MRRSWSAFRTLVVSGLAITALGCGGGGDGGSPTPPPALQINGGDAQQGTAGSAVATSPSVKVVDRDGAAPSLSSVLSSAARQQLRQRIVRRLGRNLTSFAPFFAGAVAGAELNRRETVSLGESLLSDLRQHR